ncbi:DeoR/GlpR family DNA-binding transcription regulator [Clostridium tepidum]|uniref:DeoR/GlpR family DNA-binding transcription regulator n=1 Tax=Clostridium tepidum TaxID=1962263 RepID=UPI0018A94509|nr:DeoR/GlpR family DNA-binding transcription regulator [Clostridium tepidum]MCR1933143.1 DeoR/GlpR family DNA-binding transcription regulator [Clostridium tepidum]
MLTEERYEFILKELKCNSVVYVSDLTEKLNASESTIRRDLNTLHKEGKLTKVHGGAIALEKGINTTDRKVIVRQSLNTNEKIQIAKYAASLIESNDFVYLDAGTTTEFMIDFITEKEAIFVTNGIDHAKKLIKNQCRAYMLGGEIKWTTEAIIGIEAINSLKKYNFTKGFFGTNGISKERGYTTPDIREALVKEEALTRSKAAYILADNSKFDEISSVTFANISKATIITTKILDNGYKDLTSIVEVTA